MPLVLNTAHVSRPREHLRELIARGDVGLEARGQAGSFASGLNFVSVHQRRVTLQALLQ